MELNHCSNFGALNKKGHTSIHMVQFHISLPIEQFQSASITNIITKMYKQTLQRDLVVSSTVCTMPILHLFTNYFHINIKSNLKKTTCHIPISHSHIIRYAFIFTVYNIANCTLSKSINSEYQKSKCITKNYRSYKYAGNYDKVPIQKHIII